MRFSIIYLFFLIGTSLQAQGFMLNGSLKGYSQCAASKNPKQCIDSLIQLNQNYLKHPKVNKSKTYELLTQYRVQAAIINYNDASYKIAFKHIEKGKVDNDSFLVYLETKHWKENPGYSSIFYHYEKLFCHDLYKKDTSIFFDCNCKRLFPELDTRAELQRADLVIKPTLRDKDFYKDDAHLYISPTLQIPPQSLSFFEKNKYLILDQLKAYNKIHRLGIYQDMNFKDTCIVHLSIKMEGNKLSRESEIIKSHHLELSRAYFLNFVDGLDFPNIPKEGLDLYLPFIILPTEENHIMPFDRCVIREDAYIIEYENIKKTRLHEQAK